MPVSYTYTTLRADVKAWLENVSTEFDTDVDTMINLAELRLSRDADLSAFRKYATSSTTSGDPFITKPTDVIVIRWLNIVQSGDATTLLNKSVSFLQDYWPDRTNDTGVPRFWADWDNNTILLAPTPNGTISLEMSYTRRLTALSSGNASNYLSTNCGDALLFASLLEAQKFEIINPDQLAVWEKEYQRALAAVKYEETYRSRGDEYRRGEVRE